MKLSIRVINKRSLKSRFKQLYHSVLTVLLLSICLSVASSKIYAQSNTLNTGDRVKVKAPTVNSDIFNGTVTGLSSSAIRIQSKNSETTVPLASIEELYVHNGKKRNVKAGAFLGFLTGGITFGVSFTESGSDDLTAYSNALVVLGGGMVGAAAGAIAGIFIRSDRWVNIPVVGLMSSPSSGYLNGPTVSPMISVQWSLGKKKGHSN